jgi:hypothetical protein
MACVAADATTSTDSSNDALRNEAFEDADVVQVKPDRIVYPARVAKSARVNSLIARTAEKTVPLFLIGGRQKDAVNADGTLRDDVSNPNGYLRRVTGVETAANGDISFLTRKASLTEAADELARQGFIKRADNGCFPQAINPFTAFNVDLSRSLYDHSFGSIGHMSVGLVNSHLTVDGNLDTQVAGSCFGPDAAHAILNLNLRGQVVLEGRFDGAFGAQTGDIEMFHKRVEITSVLGFPLALDFAVTANCDFASTGKVVANVGAKVDGSLSAGATWTYNDGFSTNFDPQWPQFGVVSPTFSSNASVNAQCTVTAKALALIFDGDEGPYADAAAYVNLDATGNGGGTVSSTGGTVHAKVVGGVNAGVGGTLKPFHITLVDPIEAPEFHEEWTLYEGDFSAGHR